MRKIILLMFISTSFFVECYSQCDLVAEAPVVNHAERMIVGIGSRGDGCTTNGEITVVLRVDRRFWPDKTLAIKTGSGINFRISAIYMCKGRGSQQVFTEVRAPGKKVQSKRVYISLCS